MDKTQAAQIMAQPISPLTGLLIDRTVGLLAQHKSRQGMHVNFCCVHPGIIGAATPHWVVLTKREFLTLAQPPMMSEPQAMQ